MLTDAIGMRKEEGESLRMFVVTGAAMEMDH